MWQMILKICIKKLAYASEYYNGQIDPLNLPKHYVLRRFLNYLIEEPDHFSQRRLSRIIRLVGLTNESVNELTVLAHQLEKAWRIEMGSELKKVCKVFYEKGDKANSLDVLSAVNQYKADIEQVYTDGYKKLDELLNKQQAQILKQYLTTVLARNSTYSRKIYRRLQPQVFFRYKRICSHRAKHGVE